MSRKALFELYELAITTQRTPPAHFLAAAVAIPLTVATSVWLLSFVAWLLPPYLLALLSGFYVVLDVKGASGDATVGLASRLTLDRDSASSH